VLLRRQIHFSGYGAIPVTSTALVSLRTLDSPAACPNGDLGTEVSLLRWSPMLGRVAMRPAY